MKRTCGCHSHNGLRLSPEGLAQRDRQIDMFPEVGLTRNEESVRLDMSGSVSGLRRDEEFHVFDDQLLKEQFERASYGS